MPQHSLNWLKSPISGSPIVPVPTTCTIIFFVSATRWIVATAVLVLVVAYNRRSHGHEARTRRETDRLEPKGVSRLLRPAESRSRHRTHRYRSEVAARGTRESEGQLRQFRARRGVPRRRAYLALQSRQSPESRSGTKAKAPVAPKGDRSAARTGGGEGTDDRSAAALFQRRQSES